MVSAQCFTFQPDPSCPALPCCRRVQVACVAHACMHKAQTARRYSLFLLGQLLSHRLFLHIHPKWSFNP